MAQRTNEKITIRRGDSYSGTIDNDKFRFVIRSTADLSAATAYFTMADKDGVVLFSKSVTPVSLGSNQWELAFAPAVADTIALPIGDSAGLFEVTVVSSTLEETPISGTVDVLKDLKQVVTVALSAISLGQLLYLGVDQLSSITIG